MKALLAVLVLLISTAPGCFTPDVRCPDDPVAAQTPEDRLDFKPFERKPKARIGSVPCVGFYTLFQSADPDELGQHTYGNTTLAGRSETHRGILYTVHGGFLDIAHLRKAADWTAYHHIRIKAALDNGWNCIVLPAKEATVYHIRFNYPSYWDSLPDPKRRQIIDELAIRLAQRLAIMQTNWHEIATWFGYRSTPLPEKASAFTYDDTASHILGAQVAGLALHDTQRSYDDAVTLYLRGEMTRLRAVKPDQTMRAIRMVEDKWWRGGNVIKRQLDIGEGDGVVLPWIVPAFPDDQTARGFPFVIPSLKNVVGYDLSGFERIEIDPRMSVWGRMRKLLPADPDRCDPVRHFPILMNHIRREEGASGD